MKNPSVNVQILPDFLYLFYTIIRGRIKKIEMEVRKSDGSFEEYSRDKAKGGICEAYISANEECNDVLIDNIVDNLFLFDKIDSSEIRRQIEDALMSINKKVAKEYIKKFVSDNELKKRGDFISSYINATNASSGSKYDSNANVANKNIATLNAEIPKFENIMFNRKNTSARIKKLYSNKLAKQYISDLENHILYKHDESSFGINSPYTYSAKEVVEVLYHGKNLLLPLDLLYEIVDEDENLIDSEKVVYQKEPWHLYVKDKDNQFTKVTKLTKKKRHRPLVRVKTGFGEDIVVTDNHPMISDIDNIENTTEAKDALGIKQYRIGTKLNFKGKRTIDFKKFLPTWVEAQNKFIKYQQSVIKREIDVNRELGYIVGFFVGDGNYDNTSKSLNFSQKEKNILDDINDKVYDVFGVAGKVCRGIGNCSDKYVLHIANQYIYELFRGYFKIQDKAQNKTLPYNILEFNEDFALGCMEGLIDSDGSIKKEESSISIRLASRACVLQCTYLFRHFGYAIGNSKQSLPFSNNDSYKTNYTIWGINATNRNNSVSLDGSFKFRNNITKAKESYLKYTSVGYCNVTSVEEIESESAFYELNDFIYDITTETHTFASNNLLVHNCVAIQSYPFLIDGLKGLGGLSAAPKNIDSYCGMFVNLIFAVSSQFAGAVACLYKDQKLLINDGKSTYSTKIKDLVNSFNLDKRFENFQGEWEYTNVDDKNIFVEEYGKLTKVKRVYRRKYKDKIYNIKTHGYLDVNTSKDHRFKVLYRGREIEVKAEDLKVGDTVCSSKDYRHLINKDSSDYKRGQFLGIICGDGSITGKYDFRVTVNANQMFIVDFLQEYLKENYNIEGTFTLDKRRNTSGDFRVSSKSLVGDIKRQLKECEYYNHTDKNVEIENTTLDFQFGFLDGLLVTDGSFSISKGFRFSAVNEGLCNTIKNILQNINVNKPKVTKFVSKKQNKKDIYTIHIPLRVSKYLNLTLLKPTKSSIIKHSILTDSVDYNREVYWLGAQYGKYSKSQHYTLNSCAGVDLNTDVITEISTFDNDDEYVYEIETETHWYNCGGLITHNCAGFFNMFDYFARKEWGEDYYKESDSFYKIGYKLRKLLNKSHYWTNNAVELAEHDFGSDELNKLRDEIVYDSKRPLTEEEIQEYIKNVKDNPGFVLKIGDGTRTIKGQIHQYFQQVVYGINQPAAARGFQSAFVNFGYFDKPYFEGMYGEFIFPDGTKPQWESVSFIQKSFMKWFNQERTKCVLTFPVETMSLLYVDGEYVDKEYAGFTAEMLAEGHSFFIYTSDSPDTLSSCCFSKDQKVLWKSSTNGVSLDTFEDFYNMKWNPDKKNLRVFHNGSWVDGYPVKLPNRQMFKVVTENNKEFIMTDNHINVTLDGEKTTDNLTTDDYLMFNTMALNAVPEQNEHLTYEQGFVIGAFLGDGSMGGEVNGTIYCINFSQNAQKYERMMEMLDIANKQLGGESVSRLNSVYNNVYPVSISSKEMAAFIMKWTNWKRGTYAYNKELNLNCLLQSVEFRKGILDGWYNTDCGNSNRCYTTSHKLAECMEVLITSLGMQSIIDVNDKTTETTGEKVRIRGDIEYNRNYPLYCVRWYKPANHRKNKDKENTWLKKNNSMYFKIKSIEKVNYSDDVYCIECKNQKEPYFTLPSGLITHNCRLSNKIQENTFTFTNGLTGEQTGSKSVITINFNRIMQNYVREKYDGKVEAFKENREEFMEGFKEYLLPILERVYKYHTAYNDILWDLYNANMLPVYSAGFIHLNKQYLTLGINGLNEAWMYLGGECTYNKDYLFFTSSITGFMKEQNALHRTKKEMFNSEFVPAESLGIKNYKWDKSDGYWVPEGRNCYTSYFFLPDDEHISILDKMRLHGKENVATLDGGSACHLQLKEHLSYEQYKKLLNFAGEVGCNYWTVNVKNSECKDCGYISKHTIDVCPKCGGTNFDYWTRIIGYLRKVSDFNEGRQIEEGKRYYADGDKEQ